MNLTLSSDVLCIRGVWCSPNVNIFDIVLQVPSFLLIRHAIGSEVAFDFEAQCRLSSYAVLIKVVSLLHYFCILTRLRHLLFLGLYYDRTFTAVQSGVIQE